MEPYKELECRAIGTLCDLTAKGKNDEEVIEICLEHDCYSHGICRDLRLTDEIRSRIRTVEEE